MAGGDCGLTTKVFAANIDEVGVGGERGREGASELAANPPLFPSGTEYALREIEPFLGFCQFLLEALDTMLQRLEPRSDVHGY